MGWLRRANGPLHQQLITLSYGLTSHKHRRLLLENGLVLLPQSSLAHHRKRDRNMKPLYLKDHEQFLKQKSQEYSASPPNHPCAIQPDDTSVCFALNVTGSHWVVYRASIINDAKDIQIYDSYPENCHGPT